MSIMEKDVYNAAVNGDLTIFRNKKQEQLLKKTNQNNNIIHVAAQHQQLDFIKAALNSFPSIPTGESLICDQNRHGNTPLHIAAQVRYEPLVVQLYEFYSTQCKDPSGSDRVLPWRMVNSDGNTPAHVALLYGNASVAMYLVDKDDSVARILNRSKETLLHLAVQYHEFDGESSNTRLLRAVICGNPDNESQIPETQTISSIKKANQPEQELRLIIELLLKRESSVACWTDTDGSTPLHRATSLHQAYCIPVIKAMLASCPEAAEVQDERTDHTVLHLLTNHQVASYKQGLELLQIPQVYALRNIKDHQGDTPLHLAARNNDTIMVQVLLSSSPQLGMKNKSGVSAGSLVQQLEEMRIAETPAEHRGILTKEECTAALQGNVGFLNERLVSLGMNFLVSQTPTGGNILHILLQYEFRNDTIDEATEFIEQAIEILPSLVTQQDSNGDTCVHIIAGNAYSFGVHNYFSSYLKKVKEETPDDARDGLDSPPWGMKNVKGDTPLHVAVRAGNNGFTITLLKLDEEVAGYVNNRNQTPLHLLAFHGNESREDELEEITRCMINGKVDLVYMQDEDGLTPLLTAVHAGCDVMIRKLLEQADCTKIVDFKGRTLWHLFLSPHPGQKFNEYYVKYPLQLMVDVCNYLFHEEDRSTDYIRRLMAMGDNDGNTPLHLAIANRNFDFAQFFLDNWRVDWCVGRSVERNKYEALLAIKNKDGVSSFDLIGSADHLPVEFQKSLFDNGNLLYGCRSLYGVPTTKIREYSNTIGVIAGLLATITFTAAFTVPGGLDSNNGTPLLLQKAAFQVFMVADVLAMCSSVMVLFCLLWIMTTGHKKESIILLDVSVFLLQTSFHATLVTFMTGVYVTTISIVPAIAISTCVFCTLLIILMHKRLVMLTVVPFFWMLILLSR